MGFLKDDSTIIAGNISVTKSGLMKEGYHGSKTWKYGFDRLEFRGGKTPITEIQLNGMLGNGTYKLIDKVTYTRQINWERTSHDPGDWTQTITLTNAGATNISITGTLIADSTGSHPDDEDSYRCDATLYLNGNQVAVVSSCESIGNKTVNHKVASANGVTITLVIHPHSWNRGKGSFKGTVTYTV